MVVELEETTTVEVLPEAVRKQADRFFKGNIEPKLERKLIAAYEIEGTVNGKDDELLIAPTEVQGS